MIRNTCILLMLTSFLNSCALKDFVANYSNGYIKMNQHELYTDYEYNLHMIGCMDKDVDTMGVFKVKLPPKVKKIHQEWKQFFFEYGENKVVIISIDYASRFKSKSFVQEEVNDSILECCPYYLYGKNEDKIFPKEKNVSMSTCKYLKRAKTNIYILGFNEQESNVAVNTIMDSFTFLPWDKSSPTFNK